MGGRGEFSVAVASRSLEAVQLCLLLFGSFLGTFPPASVLVLLSHVTWHLLLCSSLAAQCLRRCLVHPLAAAAALWPGGLSPSLRPWQRSVRPLFGGSGL